MDSIIADAAVDSIPALFRQRVLATPHAEAFRHPEPTGSASLTWADAEQQVREISAGMRSLGIGSEDRVGILCGTRVEWVLVDLAVLAAGGATTTIYPSNTADECAFIISDSAGRVVVAEDDAQVAKLRCIRDRIPRVGHVVVVDGQSSGDGWVVALAELRQRGRDRDAAEPDVYEDIVASISNSQLATLIYTSGTTGRPKGVELTHDNWLYAAGAVASLGILRSDDLHFLWLPLAHSFGKVLEVVSIDVGMPTVIDGRVERIAANLAEVQPTIVAAAPRIFEKIHNSVAAAMREQGGIKLALFRWAKVVGAQVSRARRHDTALPATLRLQYAVADRLVFSKLRARFGGAIRYFISGSAPLSPDMAEFFDGAGLTILEGYGLTETSAASFVNRPDSLRLGTVGPPLPGTDVRLADDGEILIRSRGVMQGYHRRPDETARTLEDGWLRTGDTGSLDDAGRLQITDRKKELIKTSGGKYVAPAHVEGKIKAASPYISHVLVHGDRRNICTALVTLDTEAIAPWARARGLPDDGRELAATAEARQLIQQAIDEANGGLARHEAIKRFAVLPADFTVETGELTASMKVRRRFVEQQHQAVLDELYDDAIEQV